MAQNQGWWLWRKRAASAPAVAQPKPEPEAKLQHFNTLFSADSAPVAASALAPPRTPAVVKPHAEKAAPMRPIHQGAPAASPKAAAPVARAPASPHAAPASAANADRPPHNDEYYLVPADLSRGEKLSYRALAIGTCLLQELIGHHARGREGAHFDFVLAGGGVAAPDAPADIDSYDFQVIQMPLRMLLRDVSLAHLPYTDPAEHEAAFEDACDRLQAQMAQRMRFNLENGLLTFVMNFMTPQFNPLGRLLPRYDLRNPEFFVERLNQELERIVRSHPNAYILDLDRIASSFGRRYIQDDTILFAGHNSFLHGFSEESGRMEAPGSVADHYRLAPGAAFPSAILAEIEAMLLVTRQADAVKLVVVDLDDTLWRGVSGDTADIGVHMFHGWPFGVAEALAYLHKRGILLAIISKNDEARIRDIWDKIVGRALPLECFAAIRINWRRKAENMAEILQATNLLPRNVLFIDDNPVERAAMQAAYPDIRIIGKYPYYLRRTLLLAPQLQQAAITGESARRTAMVQAQAKRDTERRTLSAEDFLRDQQTRVAVTVLADDLAPQFTRAFELLNKTNQFNTTGERWTRQQCAKLFDDGGRMVVFDVEDRFTGYGLVGVILVQDQTILQWAMSCRVIGMMVEQAVMAALVGMMRADGASRITARLIETDANHACRSLFPAAGFERDGEVFVLAAAAMPAPPAFVSITVDQPKATAPV